MVDDPAPCDALAEALAAAENPAVMLPAVLPCDPLILLSALHRIALRFVLSDLERADSAAAAVWCVARRFPNEPLVQAQAHWTNGSTVAYRLAYLDALGHYDAALRCYEQSCQLLAPLSPSLDVRVVQIPRVFCLTELGRYDEALAAVASAAYWLQEHPAPYAQLTLLLNQSLLAGRMGDYEQMIRLADMTVSLATELDELARAAQGWINHGHACIFLGRFAEADAAITQGSALATKAQEPLTVARAQWNRAMLLRCQGRLFDALTVLREAQRGLAQAPGEAATVALEEASIYQQLRQLPEARHAARQAADQFAHQKMSAYSADSALKAARIAAQQRRVSLAREHLAFASAQISKTQLPVLNAEIEVVESLLATLPAPGASARKRKQQQRAARTVAQRAVERLQSAGLVREAAEGELVVAALDTQLGAIELARATYLRLAAFEDQHVQMTACVELGALLPPIEALPFLQRAADLAIKQRRALPMEELQARYSSETSPYHMRLATCYLALDDIPRALESIWAGKAGPLLDLRAVAGSLDAATVTLLTVARAELARWREQVHIHQRQAWEASQQSQHEREAYHTQQAIAAAATVQASEQRLTEALRTLGDRGGQAHVPDVAEVQDALPHGTILLEYAQVDDQVLSFLIIPDYPVKYRWLGSIAEIETQHDYWKLVCHRLMVGMPLADAHRQIQATLMPLWERLLAPWRTHLADATHLLIAPCGMLHHLPWAAFYDGAAYLNDHVTVELTPSGALWAAPFEPPATPLGPPRLLGYAGSGDRRLAHVEDELDAIAGHFPNNHVKTAATAADLRASPPPRLLHIAAHALTNPSAPLCSTIELADGPFLLLEAHRLNLRGTDLVTLSACETGVRPNHGDMALALAGAFLCAGAKAVLASLWPVSDTATAALMEQFYAGLAVGVPAAEALQQAQRVVRTNHPLDWMAFQLWIGVG